MEKTLHRDHYLEQTWFDKERENILFAEWACIGRQSDLPDAGDYQVVDHVGEKILLVRGSDKILRAFFNVCRHRGCQLVNTSDDDRLRGKFQANIRCPYHSWTYTLDGSLHHAPHMDVEKDDYHLYELALDTWAGFTFVRVRPGEGGLADQLGDAPERFKRYPLADLVCSERIVYSVAANWKVMLENFNECYHCAGVHPELCEVVPDFRKGGGADLDWDNGVPHKEGANTFTATGTTDRAPFPGLNQSEKDRHFGELAYPNLMLSMSMDHGVANILRPVAPEQTEIDCRFLFHPDEVAKDTFNPSDAVDFWDVINRQDWAICESVQRGMHSRPFEYGYYAPMEDWALDIRNYVGKRLSV